MKRVYSKEEKLSRLLSNLAIFFFTFLILIKTIKFFVETGIPSWIQILDFFYILFDTTFIIALFTAFYVLFTFKLFVATKNQTDAIKEQNEESKNPNIIVKLEPFGVGGVVLKIQNVGKGNAHDVSVEFNLVEKGKETKKEKWVHSLLQPTEHVKLFLEGINYRSFLDKYDELNFQTACNGDDRRRIKSFPTSLNLKKLLEYMHGDKWLIERSTDEDIHDIAKELKEIKKEIKKK